MLQQLAGVGACVVCTNHSRYRTGQDRTGQDRTGQDRGVIVLVLLFVLTTLEIGEKVIQGLFIIAYCTHTCWILLN